ncbi:hypothetical protein [Hyphomonas jannaschiana]|uniref:hypothetical protein n=1 Tax=Hyphomonas jannaschiana TaxID=86 RepID=UPI00138DDF21|nr:hypothetical protein [Hyphomonas jannaschiana]
MTISIADTVLAESGEHTEWAIDLCETTQFSQINLFVDVATGRENINKNEEVLKRTKSQHDENHHAANAACWSGKRAPELSRNAWVSR